MIEVSRLNYHVNSKQVLTDISTEIEPCKLTTILGPNGAGKTSLLKCLSGTINNFSGTVKYNNRNIKDYSLHELSTFRAVLSQSNPVSFPFSVLEIVLMGRNPFKEMSNSNQDHEIATEALNIVDALHLKDRVFPTLSGGEQQRVQLARILTQLWNINNSILFLDEPTSALDLKHQHEVLETVKSLTIENNMTVVCILHDLNLAAYYSDKTILMLEGKLFSNGETNQILTENNIEEVYNLPVEMIRKFHFNQNHINC